VSSHDYARPSPSPAPEAPAADASAQAPAQDGLGNAARNELMPGESLEGDGRPPTDVAGIRDRLSYGLFDWEITDQEESQVLDLLFNLTLSQLRTVLTELGATYVDRILTNTTPRLEREYPSLLGKIRAFQRGDIEAFGNTGMGTTTDFSGSPLFVNGVSADDVVQGADTADCWFLSILASAAAQNPTFIQGMIRDDGGGNYAVRFYEKVEGNRFEARWISVHADLPTQGGNLTNAYSPEQTGGHRELWPSIVERAFARFWGSYSDIQYASARIGMECIFGSSGTQVTTSDDDGNVTGESDTQWTSLTDALGRHDAVVASTGSHVVSVLGASGDGASRQVEIRNQQAPAVTGSGDGRSTVPWSQFRSTYRYFRYDGTTGP
jgi:hypothetical protein